MKSGEGVGCSGPQAEGEMRAGTLKEDGTCLRLHHARGVLRGVCTDEGYVKGTHRDTSKSSGLWDLRTSTVVSIKN